MSLCKLNLEQYDQCIDQCEKILEAEPQNAKANYRMAQAVFKNNEKEQDLNQMEAALKYSTKAVELLPQDAAVKEHHVQVKEKVEEMRQVAETIRQDEIEAAKSKFEEETEASLKEEIIEDPVPAKMTKKE